jgi:triosephosphate isomerase
VILIIIIIMSARVARRCFVGGNWKCNGTRKSVELLTSKLSAATLPSNVDCVVSPSYIHLESVQRSLKSPWIIASQNANAFGAGAYTGEISAEQLKDFGIPWVILGHSERRHVFGTSNEDVGKQVSQVQKQGLGVIACVGETLDERKAEKTLEVVKSQLQAIANNVSSWASVVIAYEPVWAIGTGVVASPQQAQEVHDAIRTWLVSQVSPSLAASTRIIYGGSVKANNADELIAQPDIDGFLVGGASLNADEFLSIINSTSKVNSKL